MADMNKLVVAAVQMQSIDGEIHRNLSHAERFVAEASRRGAQLVLLPEFMPTGYDLTDAIWKAAEMANGPTVDWLRGQAVEFSISIGTSYLEATGEAFYNTFVLVDADGREAIRVRKSVPAAVEAFVFVGHRGKRVAATPSGRIGVSICYEGFLASTVRELHTDRADIVLMPHSAPTPTRNKWVGSADTQEYETAIQSTASEMARLLGVPAVMANKVGTWRLRSRWPFPDEDSCFSGRSSIADARGCVLARLGGEEEGVIVCELELDPKAKSERLPSIRGKWIRRPPKLFRFFVLPETIGRLRYAMSRKRRRAARAACRRSLPE